MGTGKHLWASWTPGVIGRSVATACMVAGPLALGIGVGHGAAGAAATLGSYLWTVGHLTVERPIGIPLAALRRGLLVLGGAAWVALNAMGQASRVRYATNAAASPSRETVVSAAGSPNRPARNPITGGPSRKPV
jgi:hypothetical protein